MADTKISALSASSVGTPTMEFGVNDAGNSKKITLDTLRDYIIKRVAAATMSAGEVDSRLVLAANSSDITGTGLTTVMAITATPAGRYWFKCFLIYQATATGTGIDVTVNHSGTTTQFYVENRFSTTGGAAATAGASGAASAATGNLYESQGQRTKNSIIGAGSATTDAADTDTLTIMEGFMVVSVSGDLQVKLAAESAGLVCRAMQGSFLELKRLS